MVFIIDIVCNLWQQILYHNVVFNYLRRNINVLEKLCNK